VFLCATAREMDEQLATVPERGVLWSVVDLPVLDRALAISRGRQRVPPRGLELLMTRQLGDHHQIVPATHQAP